MQLVPQLLFEETPQDLAATFYENVRHFVRPQNIQHGGQVHTGAARIRRNHMYLAAGRLQSANARAWSARTAENPGGRLPGRADELRTLGRAQGGVQDNTRGDPPRPPDAAGEHRVVMLGRSPPDDDRIQPPAHTVGMRPHALPRNPPGIPRAGGNLAVQTLRPLQNHPRTFLPHQLDVWRVQFGRFALQQSHFRLNAGFLQRTQAAARNERVRIAQRRDHTRHTGLDQRGGAGRRLALMAARLQYHEDRGAAGIF